MRRSHSHVIDSHAVLPTPLVAVCALTFLASIGTGVVWNGVAFIAEHGYGFTRLQTLLLYLVLGVVYAVGAISAGPLLQRVRQYVSPRTALLLVLTVESVLCFGPLAIESRWMLWTVAIGNSVLSSWLWPIVESYLTAGRHGHSMRSAIGWWNLSWTSAVALSLILMSPFMHREPQVTTVLGQIVKLEPRLAIVCLGALNAVAIIVLFWFTRFPAEHDEEASVASIQPEYPFLLRAARMLLPLSYVLNSAMTPLLPYLMNALEVEKSWQTPLSSMWMVVRIFAMAIMWQLGFWHGRWGTLLLGGLAMTLGFGLAVSGLSLPVLICGLALFGSGMGMVYYAALYYAMSVGKAQVDAGGTHEALIGVGYTVGPLAGLAGVGAAAQASRMGWQIAEGAAVVGVVWLLVGLSAIGAVGPYLKERKSRKI